VLKALRDESLPPVEAAGARGVVKIIECAVQSSRERRTIAVEP
jgi:hypothetical protein